MIHHRGSFLYEFWDRVLLKYLRKSNEHVAQGEDSSTENCNIRFMLVKKLYIYISFPLDFNGPYLVNP